MGLPLAIRTAAKPARWASVFEGTLVVVAIMTINVTYFADAPGFYGWPFNPYLLAVLVIAGRYGIMGGLFTFVLASAAYYATFAAAATSLSNLRFLTAWHNAVPLSLGITGLIVGSFASGLKNYLRLSIAKFDDEAGRFERLSVLHTLLIDEKHLLDKQVLSEEQTFESLVHLFDDLDRVSPRKIVERITTMAATLLGGGTAGLYRITVGEPNADLSFVTSNGGTWAETISPKHALISEAIKREGAVALSHIAGWMEPGRATKEPVQLACRLPSPRGQPRYILLMAGLPFAAFAPSRLNALSVSLRVAAKALNRARLFRKLNDRNVDDEVTGASSMAYFWKRLDETYSMSARHRMPVSIVTIRPPARMHHGASRLGRKIHRQLANALRTSFRKGDLVAYARKTRTFHILLPFTSLEAGQVLTQKLKVALEANIPSRLASGEGLVSLIDMHSVDAGQTSVEELKATIMRVGTESVKASQSA